MSKINWTETIKLFVWCTIIGGTLGAVVDVGFFKGAMYGFGIITVIFLVFLLSLMGKD